MWSSTLPHGWRHWSCRTKRSSMICCSRQCGNSSRSRSDPQTRRGNRLLHRAAHLSQKLGFIPMSIASFPPAACRSITRQWINRARDFFSPSRCFVASPRQVRCGLQRAFQETNSISMERCHYSLTPRPSPPGCGHFPKGLGGLCETTVRWPQYVLQYLGRYTHRVAISNHRLVSFVDGQVTFRWRDSLTTTSRSC